MSFRDMPVDDDVEIACITEVEKLERYCGRVTGCHVVVSAPHRHHRKGQLFDIRIHLTIPGGEIVASRTAPAHHESEKLRNALREAFDAVRRQLEDKVRRQRHQVKAHGVPPHGKIARLVPGQDHGFIETFDGREIYFHRNSVLAPGFGHLRVGTEVRFTEEAGERGLQAASVAVIRRGQLPPAETLPPHV